MSKFKKMMFAIIALEILVIVVGNIICINKINTESGRLYRVECNRVALELEKILAGNDVNSESNFSGSNAASESDIASKLDFTQYKTILGVRRYNPDEICRDDYVVVKVEGSLYRILYRATKDYQFIYIMNGILAFMLILSAFILIYIDRKVFVPFKNMQTLSVELAKGNLSTPIKEEKSKFFGRFLWSMDLLRENLEEKKQKELTLHKERKTLILSLSHDIKTPLSAIELYMKALREGLYDTEKQKADAYIGVCKNVEEIKNYVNEITQASRDDFLNLEVQNKEIYLHELIAKITLHYKEKLAVKHIEVHVDEVSNCLLFGDGDRLEEVIQNIMENAIKYGDGNKINISFDDEEDCKLICISNTGNTPKEEELPHLMESFYRGSNHGNEKGSGLGLYICKNLMKKMDGDVFVKISDNHFLVTVVVKKA